MTRSELGSAEELGFSEWKPSKLLYVLLRARCDLLIFLWKVFPCPKLLMEDQLVPSFLSGALFPLWSKEEAPFSAAGQVLVNGFSSLFPKDPVNDGLPSTFQNLMDSSSSGPCAPAARAQEQPSGLPVLSLFRPRLQRRGERLKQIQKLKTSQNGVCSYSRLQETKPTPSVPSELVLFVILPFKNPS